MKNVAPSTIEKVLSIALRLAAPPALLACGSQAQPAPPSAAQPTLSSPTSSQSSGRDSAAESLVTSKLLPDTPNDVPEESCEPTIASALEAEFGPDYDPSELSWFNPDNSRMIRDPAAMACCEALASDRGKTEEFRSMQCCQVDVDPQIHCTPWGPPMPTAMA